MTGSTATHANAPARTLFVAGTIVALLAALAMTRSARAPRTAAAVLGDLATAGNLRIVEPRNSVSSTFAVFRGTAVANRRASIPPALQQETKDIALPAEPGRTSLFLGHWTAAIQALERSPDARSSIDLAAAYYMRGVSTDSFLDFCRALDALRNADAPEATFNRALILEQLTDLDAAAEEWRRYLRSDSDSGWADEARTHLEHDRRATVAAVWLRDKPFLLEAASSGNVTLVRELAARHPLATRQMVERELLPAWGKAKLERNRTAEREALHAARVIVAERALREDLLLTDAIEEIDHADADASIAFANAYKTYGEAVAALERSEHQAALDQFARALSFAANASVLPALIEPNIATAHYRRSQYAAADAQLAASRLRYRDRERRYPSLFARLDWLEGLNHIARPDATRALRSYERALAVYERLGEAEFIGAQHINLADSYMYLGENEKAAVHLGKALNYVSRTEDPQRLQGLLKTTARFSLENGAPHAAVAFQNRLVRVARTMPDPMRLPDALVSRSSVLSRTGQREQALRDLAEVRQVASRIGDDKTRLRLQADACAAEAYANRDYDDRRAIENLSCAYDILNEMGMRATLVSLLLARGRTQLRIGDAAAAERDFRKGIDILEGQRKLVREPPLRITYFDRANRIFVDLAALLLARGDSENAFELLERFRSRELLDQTTSGTTARPIGLTALRARLPGDTVLVTQTPYDDGLLTIVVTRDAVRGFMKKLDGQELGNLLDAVGSSFVKEAALPVVALRRLGEILFDGIEPRAGSRIVFIPDGGLARVPYAALLQKNGQYLIESHVLAHAPSATLYAWALGHSRRPHDPSPSILIIASRTAPAGVELPRLTRTVEEARRAAARYPHNEILEDDVDGATILSRAHEHALLHLATHAMVDLRDPSRSALLIGSTERLTAAQIEASDLSNLELVVLGGCSTGLGRNYRSESPLSLARAFVAAGVPAVVGTIASVDDRDAERVLSEFHRGYAIHRDAPRALRDAQLLMLHGAVRSNREPARWAAFHVIGATVSDRR
ncbi:MAG TPA: CHAT domain-containing protein [Thermoanaerobaculia bacterium]|nr:CHAT domain-containing protein [Thermoanaerobaculia bacterium]